MPIEQISGEVYGKINDSQLAVADFLTFLNENKKLDYHTKGELQIGYNNLINIDLLKTNADMLFDELFLNKTPKGIIILSESYLTKLCSIGALTLEQIACSLIGKYDPFKPEKKEKLENIKKTVKEYAGPELSKSFLDNFMGIFNEVSNLRNMASHSNLAKNLFLKEEFKKGSWDSERQKNPLYNSRPKQSMYGFLKGDLSIIHQNGEASLTDKLNEYSIKYLEMVKDVYNGLLNHNKSFMVKL